MDIKTFRGMNEVFNMLNNSKRWSDFLAEDRYNEMAKQSLNCIVTFVLAAETENRGVPIKWERFPKIAIYRAFQKAYSCFDIPEHILKKVCDRKNISYEKAFNIATWEIIEEVTDKDFANLLKEGTGTYEERVFKAGTKIATLLELREIEGACNGDYLNNLENVVRSMAKYQDVPGFNELADVKAKEFKAFKYVSKLRNRERWLIYSCGTPCSVLVHLFDTAVYAYLMALEQGETEEVATKYFFIGIFHDVAETFTGDIPSLIKDRIPGLREASEEYEDYCMEEYFYPLFSKHSQKAIKDVTLGNKKNEGFKQLIKGADYLSATSEIWRQFNDQKFLSAMERHGNKFKNENVKISETGMKLYEEQIEYVKDCLGY